MQGEWNPFLSLVRARARASSCASCAVGLGWLRADSLLRVCGGGVWRPLSFASGVGQGRLGVVGCLDGHLLSTFPSFAVGALLHQRWRHRILGKTTILYSPALRRVNSIPDFHSEFRILRIPEAGGEEFSGGRTASLPHSDSRTGRCIRLASIRARHTVRIYQWIIRVTAELQS